MSIGKAANDNMPPVKFRRPEQLGPWLMSSETASESGSRFFFDGIECSKGHVARKTLDGRCTDCASERSRKAYWANAEDKREKARLAHHENRDANLIRIKEYGQREWDRIRVRRLAYNEINRDHRVEQSRLWYDENKAWAIEYRKERSELYAVHARNRRALIRGNGGTHTEEDIERILQDQKCRCAECGISIKDRATRHVDHIMPISLGGSNDPYNLQILCAFCNLSKGASHPFDFARRQGRLL